MAVSFVVSLVQDPKAKAKPKAGSFYATMAGFGLVYLIWQADTKAKAKAKNQPEVPARSKIEHSSDVLVLSVCLLLGGTA